MVLGLHAFPLHLCTTAGAILPARPVTLPSRRLAHHLCPVDAVGDQTKHVKTHIPAIPAIRRLDGRSMIFRVRNAENSQGSLVLGLGPRGIH